MRSILDKFSTSKFGEYKYLEFIVLLYVIFQLVSDVTAGKVVSIFGITVSVTVIYFPFTYLISDILTEVYGYAIARKVLWRVMFASILAALLYQVAVYIPPATHFEKGQSYTDVLGQVPRILVFGWIAVFSGDIVNNYVMAKMKVFTRGKHLWSRAIASTVAGQAVNTAVFYVGALYGVIPTDLLIMAVLYGWIIKSLVEIVFTPLTYAVTNYLKREEKVDYYDTNTSFNPFIIR
jgi:uncharacterized integral membrane protein (TIGR00697 family)